MDYGQGPELKRSAETLHHKAIMATKAGKVAEAAQFYEKASDAMFRSAEYASSRNQAIDRKKIATTWRRHSKRLLEPGALEEILAHVPTVKSDRNRVTPSHKGNTRSRGSGQEPPEGSAPEISSAVASMVQTSPLTWDDIGGLEETKRDIKYTLGLSLAKPPANIKLHTFRNILFYGPPGTGKTILAAATSNALRKGANEKRGAMFFNVKVSGVMSKYFGESSKILSEVYGTSRDNSPSVVFLDEFESLTGKRGSDDQSGAEKRILSTILSELDGLSEKGRGDIFVLTIAATNRPWDVDNAVLSRFEKRILIPLPDEAARQEIIDILFLRRGFETTANMSDVVALSEGYSGREIERLCKEVTTHMISDMNSDLPSIIDAGLDQAQSYEVKTRAITIDDWQEAASKITPATTDSEMDKYRSWNDNSEG